MLRKVLGFKKGQNAKTQNPTIVLWTVEELNSYDSAHGCVGQKAQETYAAFDVVNIKVGQIVDFIFDKGYQDKAVLVDVIIQVEPDKK